MGDVVTQIPINWWMVIIAALLRMVVGSVWYSPAVFVKPWQRLAGITPETMQQGLPRAIVIDLVMSLIMSFVLYHAVVYAGANSWWAGALVGLLSWLGFVLATHLPLWAYENRNLQLIAIGVGSNLVSMVLMGVLFGLWH
jgi:hypothetical protein